MSKCIFVTGTDTGIGKTVITGCIAAAFLRKRKKVAIYKPIQCGNLLNGKIKSPDLNLVKTLSGIDIEDLHNDYCFKMAASPHLAAEQENKKVSIDRIKSHLKSLQKRYDVVLIEGAGGLLVPITRSYTILDLIKYLSVPVLVVARAGLGTINHTSMSLQILKENKVPVIGVLMNNYVGGILQNDNKKIVSQMNKTKVLAQVPNVKSLKSLADNFEKYFDVGSI